jgi:hypothetical protein
MQMPIVGPGYLGRSLNLDASRCVNLYAEKATPDAKSVSALIGTPGTVAWSTAAVSPVRGAHPFAGNLYVVAGAKLYSVTAAGAISAVLGQLLTSSGRVLMCDNGLTSVGAGGNQLAIVDGVAGYVYNVSTGAFTASSAFSGGGWPSAGADALTYMDGYFIAGATSSMTVVCSDLYDGTTWNALAQSPVSAAPDSVKALANIVQQLWIVKEYTSEVWYDAGTATNVGFPFLRVPGTVIDYGTPAPYSVAHGAYSLFFLANQRNNDGGEFVGVVQVQGYSPTVITPPAITYQMSRYPTLADAFGYCYSDGGHTFYVLTFPTANATWVYDATTGLWHERSTWTGAPYQIGRHVGNCYANFSGMHLVGDWQSGAIYRMGEGIYTDNGEPLVSVRTFQHMADKKDLLNTFFKRFLIDTETGVGNDDCPAPSAALSWSDDGGHTWSDEYRAAMGAAGQYRTRVIWRRLGCSRDRIFRVAISDPIKRVLIGGYVE